MHRSTSETSRKAGANDVTSDDLLDQELMSGQGADTEDIAEEALLPALSSARRLIQAFLIAVPVFKNSFVGLTRSLAADLHSVRRKALATTAKLVEREATLSELDLKDQLLAKTAGHAGDVQKREAAKRNKL